VIEAVFNAASLSSLYAEPLPRPGTRLRLETLVNLRDLGGYETVDGRRTRRGRVYRSDAPVRVTAVDLERLRALGLRMVCDLRRQVEVEKLPVRLPMGVGYDHVPMGMPDEEMGSDGLPRPAGFDWSVFRLESLYVHMLDHSHVTYRRLFAYLADASCYPFLFHCAVGKDRTGVVAALLQRLAGVPDELVVQDFVLSATYIEPLLPELRRRIAERGEDAAAAERLFEAPAEALVATLDHLDATYGSARAYLETAGVPEEHVEHFLSAFVE
jgi:protein-tyrosine phosphatase